MPDNGDNLTVQEKLILHQTNKMEILLNQLSRQIEALTKAVTAGNVIDRLTYLASNPPPERAVIESAEEWKNL
jgi:hypothetical protein